MKKMKNLCIIQARLGSTRLPGKVLMKVNGIPLLEYEIKRVRQAKNIDKIVVATTDNKADNQIASLCKKLGIDCFRGSENDVLDRYYQCSLKYPEYKNIVRITGDCPLADAEIIDQVLNLFMSGNYDYATNAQPPTFPDGLDVEVFSFWAIEKAWQNAKSDFEREHVNVYIYENQKMFKKKNIVNGKDLSKLRWTLDTPEDLKLLNLIIKECDKTKKYCHLNDILKILEKHPGWKEINSRHERNQGHKIGY